MAKPSLTDKYLKQRTKLTENLEKSLKAGGKRNFDNDDEGFWQPSVDKTGNGGAVIRFLPAGGDEELPYVHYYQYSFQGPTGQWYIEKSRTSLGRDERDPCHEFVQPFWLAKDEVNARKYSGKKQFISNILVIKDPEKPENNGKVFLFRYGAQIQKKIQEAMTPNKELGETSIDAFDLIDGANFKLIVGKKDKYRTFENSKFDNPSPLVKDLKDLEPILEQCKPLQPFVDPSTFKSYDDLKKRLERVLGDVLTKKPGTAKAESAPKMDTSEEPPFDLDSDDTSLDDLLKGVDV